MQLKTTIAAAAFLMLPAAAAAQAPPQPIPKVVADLRAFYSGLGQDARTAEELGVTPADLPSRGLGATGGVHFYPYRKNAFAIGIGGELMLARGRKTPTDPVTGEAIGPTVEQRLFSLSPQLSLNFGHRDGWSYLAAGMGPLAFETFKGDLPPAESPVKQATLNAGGGARWFASSHVAFCFDVRFYFTSPADTTPTHPGRNRNKLLFLSAGIAIR
jgi:hypothetical protein